MNRHDDHRLDESRAIPMAEVIDRLGIAGLKRSGAEMVGPCPICGGTDRFAVNIRNNMALCRRCGLKSGDQVGLVREVLGLGFRDALGWLMGAADPVADPAEVERRRERARRKAAAQEAEAERRRAWAARLAREIWAGAEPATSPVLRAYLEGRGFSAATARSLPATIRFIGNHPMRRRIGGETVTLHTGPCMIARIDSSDRDCIGVHQTWLDPDRPGKKARVTAMAGKNGGRPWPAKLIVGSKKGGVVILNKARDSVLVMGEGIETTLTAREAGVIPGAACWAGVDLGNMGGRMQHVPGRRASGIPDMTDDRAFVPPVWVRRLVFIQDGDSDPATTRARLLSGLRRAMALRPGLKAQIVHAGEGVDLNDLIQDSEERT